MRVVISRPFGAVLIVAAAVTAHAACGSSPDTSSPCVQGQSLACAGPHGCSGFQTCQVDGTFSTCECGSADSGSPSDSTLDSPGDTVSGADAADAGEVTPDSTASESSDTIDGTTGPLSPKDIPGLSLWLDSDKGITLDSGGTVSLWADQSGNFNNGKGGCGGPYGPAVIKAALHGHDALRMGSSGANCGFIVNDDASLQFGTGAFAVVAVVQQNSSTSLAAENLFVKQGATTGAGLFMTIDSNVNVTTPSAAAHVFMPSSGYHVVVIRGPALEARIDGVTTKGTTSSDDVSYPGSWIMLGHNDGRELDVTEIIAVKGVVTDDQVSGMEDYLKTKYGLIF